MPTITTVQRRLLQAKIALALLEELGWRPTDQELQLTLRVFTKAVSGYTLSPGGTR